MKISVITVCRNEESTINDTLRSVMKQTHGDIEHIIIDGNSTDDTSRIALEYAEDAHYPVIVKKEKSPGGIYAALNQAIALASGDVVATLHANDFFAADDILESVAREFESNDVDIVYGNVEYFRRPNTTKTVRRYYSNRFVRDSLLDFFAPPHPATFFRRAALVKHGGYSQDYLIAGDFELMVRLLLVDRLEYSYLDRVVVAMSMGGISTKLRHRLSTNIAEKWRALKQNNQKRSLMALLRRCLYY